MDSFAEEDHNPFSDHDDFANVMPDRIMDRLVGCVNEGRKCRE
ncbi:secreted protein [Amycolatopsis azurea DSM 43854]|uniref:Secreted protein n=1 Tax=Amycolatopsis azurea DSM 43854 TaxID=1238180 RepID=M2PHM8_9PSEU|nr:secreted protein [Amycolatopsis azurea DSM 43854]